MENIEADSDIVLEEREQQALPVKIFAHIISYVFHPLFIATYVTAFLLFVHPFVFAGYNTSLKTFRLVTVIVNTLLIPGLAVFFMWRLKLLASIQLKTTKERIIPYAAAIIFYFWCWLVFKRLPDTPAVFVNFIQGSFFAVCGAWMININSKISMHTTAMGGMLTFFLLFSFQDDALSGLYLSMAVLIAGVVGSARLIVSDHTRFQIIQGYVVGALAQVVAWWI